MTPSGSPPGVALVTGSASGIGAATARRLRQDGWQVTGFDLVPSGHAGDRVGSVLHAGDLRAVVGSTVAEHGRLDVVVSCAGRNRHTPFLDISDQEWAEMCTMHVMAPAILADLCAPLLRRSGGSMTVIASELAYLGSDDNVHYGTAKGAVVGLFRALAADPDRRGISWHMVAPGPTDTPMIHAGSHGALGPSMPLGRLASTDEIASTVVRLATLFRGGPSHRLSPNGGTVTQWID